MSSVSKFNLKMDLNEIRISKQERLTDEHDKKIAKQEKKQEELKLHIEKIYEESKNIKNLEDTFSVIREVTEKRIDDMKKLVIFKIISFYLIV